MRFVFRAVFEVITLPEVNNKQKINRFGSSGKTAQEDERTLIRYLIHIPPPASIDVLSAVAGLSSLVVLNVMEKLRGKRIVYIKKHYDKGLYFVDPVFSANIADEQALSEETEPVVRELIRYYTDRMDAGKEKTLILAGLYSKIASATDEGFACVAQAAQILEQNEEEEKALSYYRYIRRCFKKVVPTKNNVTIYLESVLKENLLSGKPEPVEDKIAVFMEASRTAKQYDRWDYFARITLEWCSELNVAGQIRRIVQHVNGLNRLAAKIDNPQIYKLIALTKSTIHFFNGRLSEAASYYEDMVGDLEEFGDNEEVLKVAALMGWCHVRCGRVARGMGMLDGIRTKARSLNMRRVALLADLQYIHALLDLRKSKEAEAVLNSYEVSPFFGKSIDHFMAWHIERARIYALYASGEYEKAFERHRESVRQLLFFGWWPKHTPWSLECLQGLEARGFIDENMRYGSEVARLINGDDIHLKGFALRFRAEDSMEKKYFGKEVLADLIKSEKCQVRAGAEIELARTRIAIGNYYLKKGNRKSAQVHLEKAWKFFSTIDKGLFPTGFITVLPQEQKTELMMNKVIDLNESLGMIRDTSSFLQRVLGLAMDFTMAMRGGFIVLESGESKMMISRNVDPSFLTGEVFQKIGQAIKEAYRDGVEIIVPASGKDNKPLVEAFRKVSIDSFIAVPARLGTDVYGYLCLDSRIDGTPFPEENLLFLRVLCSQIALGLSNIGIYDEMKRLKDHYEEEASFYKQEMGIASPLETIIGESPAVTTLINSIRQVAPTDSSVLIGGETGVGKELVAKAIHNLSKRKEGPFIPVNLAALPQELVVSELFGHEKGAFTGANERRKGRFELADGGTIFLDEIGDLSPNAQVKLLRVLQEGTFERLGSAKPISSNFRVIAASNKNLYMEVEKGAFRQDLFYRLDVFPIHIPPLRERREDIVLLANHFVDKYSRKFGKRIRRVPVNEMKKLLDYHWPGNVRELEHFIERAIIFSDGHHISFSEVGYGPKHEGAGNIEPRAVALADVERNHIRQVLQQTEWKIYGRDGAATILGLKPSTLQSRMIKLGIKRPT